MAKATVATFDRQEQTSGIYGNRHTGISNSIFDPQELTGPNHG
jgi:hypothetical protein